MKNFSNFLNDTSKNFDSYDSHDFYEYVYNNITKKDIIIMKKDIENFIKSDEYIFAG